MRLPRFIEDTDVVGFKRQYGMDPSKGLAEQHGVVEPQFTPAPYTKVHCGPCVQGKKKCIRITYVCERVGGFDSPSFGVSDPGQVTCHPVGSSGLIELRC